MKKYINENNLCNGCGSCYNICPQNAIKMQQNEQGFLYPEVDDSICVNCGLCAKICPIMNVKYLNSSNPRCFAVMGNDQIRMNKSSSGGVFTVLAEYILKNGGFVCGAAFNSDGLVEHVIVDNLNDLEKLKGSKYVQSDTKEIYRRVKQLLEADRGVLFTGTPCQVAGLNSFLQKDYENLVTVDIICHGVPSPVVYKKYIKELIGDEKFVDTNFRDKKNGWTPSLTTTTTTTTTTVRTHQNASCTDDYMRAFLQNLSLRESCFECPFQNIPRQADITIGDFWGVEALNPSYNDQKGTSVLIVNNEHGESLIKKVKKEFKLFEQAPLEMAKKGNPCLYKSVEKPTADRKQFFELIKSKTLKECIDICLDDKCDYWLINFWWSGYNYGAVLTAYAMQELINSYGFSSKFLDTGESTLIDNYSNTCFANFTKQYLKKTRTYTLKDIKKKNTFLKGVILGSDQVLRYDYIKGKQLDKYLLNFVQKDKKKFLFSGSFGVDEATYSSTTYSNKEVFEKIRYAYSSFDYLSTREISGKEILKKYFNLNSDYLLDPVFLINKNLWNDICSNSNVNGDEIISYVLDDNEDYNNAYIFIEETLNKKVKRIDPVKANVQVEDWLKYIRDCRLLITDSFHGVCFALIFNKPFICIKNKDRGCARFDSLIQMFDIDSGFISSIKEIYNLDLENIINYTNFNVILNAEISRCKTIVEKVLFYDFSNNVNANENKLLNEEYIAQRKQKLSTNQRIKLCRYKILSKLHWQKKKRKKYREKIENILNNG